MLLTRILLTLLLASFGINVFASPEPSGKKALRAIWGVSADPLMIVPDMWTFHLLPYDERRMNNNNNPMLCVSYKGLFAGTFINSFNRRTYAVGVQRYWLERHPSSNVIFQLGYRLGLMYGYQIKGQKNLLSASPIFPAFQIISDLSYKHLGLEVSYTDVVITGSLFLRF